MSNRLVVKMKEMSGKYGALARFHARFSRDQDYRDNMANFDLVFQRRESLCPNDENIGRIVVAYQKARRDMKAASFYDVSNEWLPIYRRYLGSIMAALSRGDIANIKALYKNFFREELCNGLAGLPTNMKRRYMNSSASFVDKSWFVQDAVYRLRYLESLRPGFSYSDLDVPVIGNHYGITVNGRFIRTGADYQYYYASKTAEILRGGADGKGRKVVLELGGGYVGYAYFLSKCLDLDVTYVDIDLPEILALATFYLMAALPDARFRLYGEASSGSDLPGVDFMMMPSFELENMETSSVDLIFNSYSLAEMSPPAIRNYVSQFGRIDPDHVFHVNHTKNSKLGADGFGLEDLGFVLLEKRRALWNLGRSVTMDEFEYLYAGPTLARPGPAAPQ